MPDIIEPSAIESDRIRVRNLTSDNTSDLIDVHRIEIDGTKYAVRNGTGKYTNYRYWLLRDGNDEPDWLVRTHYVRHGRHYGADPWHIDTLVDARVTHDHNIAVHGDPGFFRDSPGHQLTDHREILTEFMRRCL